MIVAPSAFPLENDLQSFLKKRIDVQVPTSEAYRPLHLHWRSHASLDRCDSLAVEAFSLAELLRSNRAPEEVILMLEDEDTQLQKAFAKAGRNELCPNGSVRTFKHFQRS